MTDNFTKDEMADTVIARINTTDELYIKPFREYLEANGCKVFVNKATPDFATYHIICGDLDFVKKILADGQVGREKILAILWGGTKREVESLVHTHHLKVWVANEKSLDSRIARDIFAFFFTSSKSVFVSSGEWKETPMTQEEDKIRIKSSIATIFGPTPLPQKEPERLIKKIRRPKNVLRPILVCLVLFSLFCLPFFWYIASLTVSGMSLYVGAQNIKSGNSAKAHFWSSIGSQWVGNARNTLSVMSAPIRLVKGDGTLLGQEHTLSLLDDIVVSENGIAGLLEEGSRVASLLLTQRAGEGSSESPAVSVEKLQTSLTFVENRLGLAQAELTRLLGDRPFPFWIPQIFAIAERASSQLSSYHQSIGYIGNALSLYPEIAGFKEKKTYLVLFQNSMELRPTGGFIGSLALLSFADGRLDDIAVEDVYAMDGQLKGHVDPPGPIRDILHQEHWYLRDSNWDPDFANSGERAAWFYEKETGQTVDGVFAISVPLVTDLLQVTGPLDLPDYNDRITADNFFGKSIFYTQTDFFPGSTQKKDFLGTLVSSLLTKLTTSKNISQASLFKVLTKALQSGDVLLFFHNKEQEDLVSRFGWAGRVPLSDGCQGVRVCSFDPLTENEANLGVNKANYYVEKTMLRQIALGEDGTAKETLTISYKNVSSETKPSPGGGPYQAYVRFYLPQSSQLDNITLDGTTVPTRDTKKKTPPEPPYWEKDATNTNVVGVAFAVGPGDERKLSVAYTRQGLVRFENNKAVLDIAFQKQPGAPATNLATDVTFPIFWTGRDVTRGGLLTFLAKQAKLSYNTTLVKNDTIRIEFTK